MGQPAKESQSPAKHMLGLFSSIFISTSLVLVSAFLLRMGVEAAMPVLPQSHLDNVTENVDDGYDLSNFKFEWANLAHAALGVRVANAAGYDAVVVEQPETVVLKPGARTTIKVKVRNTGDLRWRTPQTGNKYASIYTYEPKYHLSRLEDKRWRRRDQPAVLVEQTEAGQVGVFEIPVTAPYEPGTYKDTFQMAIEDTAWVRGGKIMVTVVVEDKPVVIELPQVEKMNDVIVRSEATKQSPASGIATPPTETSDDRIVVEKKIDHKALLLVRSHRRIKKPGGTDVLMRFGFKNTGDSTWLERGISTDQVALAALSPNSSFAHSSWLSSTDVAKLAAGTIAPGATDFFTFSIRTPEKKGDYDLKLYLLVDGLPVDGGVIDLPVTVTSNASNSSGKPIAFEGQVKLADEPRIRVGVFKPEEPLEFKSDKSYVLVDGNGSMVTRLPANTLAVIHYKDGEFIFYAKGVTHKTNTFFRLEPQSDRTNSIFEIVNHEERPKWNTSLNYNAYRDTFEVRYSQKNEKVWFINELRMEPYIAGLAEVSNNTPEEFRKAIAVAERTYAYYQLQGNKHIDRHFDVSASQGDQVYRGYNREKRFDKVVEGVVSTRGQMVTYNKDVVVTPYYARSDGKTLTWKQAWGGSNKPWLKSVVTEYDRGKTRWGHGVGMSQRDATHRADKEDINYIDLLKHYYTGVEVQKIYK